MEWKFGRLCYKLHAALNDIPNDMTIGVFKFVVKKKCSHSPSRITIV